MGSRNVAVNQKSYAKILLLHKLSHLWFDIILRPRKMSSCPARCAVWSCSVPPRGGHARWPCGLAPHMLWGFSHVGTPNISRKVALHSASHNSAATESSKTLFEYQQTIQCCVSLLRSAFTLNWIVVVAAVMGWCNGMARAVVFEGVAF